MLAEKYGVSDTTIAAAWIAPSGEYAARHRYGKRKTPERDYRGMQYCTLTREEWYELYLAADLWQRSSAPASFLARPFAMRSKAKIRFSDRLIYNIGKAFL